MSRRNTLNLLLLTGVLTLLSFSQLPRIVHELVGILMVCAILAHLGYARGWLKGLTRGRWTVRRMLGAMLNALLALNVATILVTGVIASNFLFIELVPPELHRNLTLHQLHTALGWSMPILVGLHIGLHGAALWQRFTHHFVIPRGTHRTRLVCRGLKLLTILLGIYASILNRVGDRLRMEHIFATEAAALPYMIFVLLILALIGMYAVLGAAFAALIERKSIGNQKL